MNKPALPLSLIIVPPPPAKNGTARADDIPPPIRNRGQDRLRGGRIK